jgi:hypothetical protein
MMGAFVARFACFLGVWLVIANWKLSDLPIGIAASALALWISLRLTPPSAVNPRLVPSARLAFRLLSFSIIAGVDVARRALLPQVDLNPGFVSVALTLEPGASRNAFLRACSRGLCRRATKAIDFRFIAWTSDSLLSRASPPTRPCSRRRSVVSELLLAASGLILLAVALGRALVLRGPGDVERVMALQLVGTGGIAALLVIAYATNVPGVDDVALGLALLPIFSKPTMEKRKRDIPA